jgi:hypothetical protein
MADSQSQPAFGIDLAEKGGHLTFNGPDDLRKWVSDEQSKWLWLAEAGRPMTEWLVNSRQDFFGQLDRLQNHWRQYQTNPSEVSQAHLSIKNCFEQFLLKGRVLISNTPAAAFIFQLREKHGDKVAAGAYASVLNSPILTSGQTQSEFFEGIVEGFLFKREINWTASGHQQELNRLKNQYDGEIGRQDARFKEIQEANRALNAAFDVALKSLSE